MSEKMESTKATSLFSKKSDINDITTDLNYLFIDLVPAKVSESSLLSLLSEKDLKKFKPLPDAGCKVKVTQVELEKEKNVQRVDVNLSPLLPIVPEIDENDPSKWLRQVPEFTFDDETEILPSPYSSYRNQLYVYPLTVNLAGNSARNITVEVSLVEEDKAEAKTLRVRLLIMTSYLQPFTGNLLTHKQNFINKIRTHSGILSPKTSPFL
jgi:hypothetical protein